MRTSIVIPVRNQPGCIRWTLESLARQDAGVEAFDVVVVDDASTDSTPEVVSSFTDRLDLKLVRNKTNRGRGGARNAGAAAASGDHLVLLDSDSYSPPDLISRHIAWGATRADQVFRGRRIEMGWWTMGQLAKGGESAVSPLSFEEDQRDSRGLSDTENDFYARTPWLFMATHNMSLSADLFHKVGGFDEGLRGWGYEDNEFAYRVFREFDRAPGHFVYDPGLLCYHLPHFRDWTAEWNNTPAVLSFIKNKHRHFDVEFLNHPPNHLRIAQTIPYYERGVAHVSAAGDPKILRTMARAISVPGPALWIGCGTSALKGSAPGLVAYDHDRPDEGENRHALGAFLPYRDGGLKSVVNVDLWRFLSPVDLSSVVLEGLRAADSLYLACSKHITSDEANRLGLTSDLHYVSEMFVDRYTIDVVADDESFAVVRLRPSGASVGG